MKYFEIIDELRNVVENKHICSEQLLQTLFENRCYNLLLESDNCPAKVQSIYIANSIALKQRFVQCGHLFEVLDSIPYAILKGTVLSKRVYGNWYYRVSEDIDILISPEHIEEVSAILRAEGFIQGRIINDNIVPYTREEIIYQRSFTHQIAPFIKESNNRFCPFTNIDVNFDIVWGEEDLQVDLHDFLKHTDKIHFDDNIWVRQLQPEWEFIALCMHHYKDMNSIYLLSVKGLDLLEFCDIYFYVLNVSLNADILYDIATKYKIDRYVYYCLYYAHQIFRDPKLEPYLERFYTENACILLSSYGLSASERRIWQTPFFERLLDRDFYRIFYSSLDSDEQKKVEINRKYM